MQGRRELNSPRAASAAPHVRAERHFHPVKAQLVTAAGMGALTVGATALLAPMLGVSPWSLVGVEQAFWACMVCASAGETTCRPDLLISALQGINADMQDLATMCAHLLMCSLIRTGQAVLALQASAHDSRLISSLRSTRTSDGGHTTPTWSAS